jgi:hypothetical protein
MYEGCEAVLMAAVQAALTRLRSDRFGAGRSGLGELGSADRVLYVCGHVARRRDEVSVSWKVGTVTRLRWGTFVGVCRGVGPESSSSSFSESEERNWEGFRMRIGGTGIVLSGLEDTGLRLGSRDGMGDGEHLSWRVSLEGPGRDEAGTRRGRGFPDDLSTKELGTEDSSACESYGD